MNIARVFVLLHIVIAISIVFILRKRSYSRLHTLADMIIILFFPLGGYLIVWLLEDSHRVSDCEQTVQFDSEKLDESKVPAAPIDPVTECDIAPFQEIFLVADYAHRREVLLDIMKTDILANMHYIETALHNDDSETVHYAATGLQHVRQKLDTRLYQLRSSFEHNPDDMQTAAAYVDVLEQYLGAFSLDTATRQQYLQTSIQILIRMTRNTDLIRIRQLIENLLAAGQFQQAREYCQILFKEYPDSELKYLVLLKSFFMMKDKNYFDQVLKQFRASDIYFSDDTLNLVRLWLGVM